jgi:outer membrane protein insertion porin family
MLARAVIAASLLVGAPAPERVNAVRIDGLGSDGQRYRRYIGIRPGSYLDSESVRHAAELLFATGEFEDVIVLRETTADGLVIVFRPVPAPRLARIAVVGDSPLSVGKLRDIARLRRGEHLWPERLRRAAADIARALNARGYLQARVETQVLREFNGAIAVFHVEAGRRVVVDKCRLVGSPESLQSILASELRPRAGEAFEEKRARQAAEKMERLLREAGFWSARVRLSKNLASLGTSLELVFEVESGLRTDALFVGGELGASMQRRLKRLLRDGRLTQDVLDEVTEHIEDDFRRRGYSSVAVTCTEERSGDGALVIYTIETGAMKRLNLVRIMDAPRGFERNVSTVPGDPFVEQQLEEDAQRLELALEEAGYPRAAVAIETSGQNSEVAAVFRVTPGPRVFVGAVSIESPEPISSEPSLELSTGASFRASDVTRARDAIVRAYRNEGYTRVEVTPRLTYASDETRVDIVFEVRPGMRSFVEHIVIAGLVHTHEGVVRRELTFSEGEPLSPEKVFESQRRLGMLGLFRGVGIREMSPEARTHETLIVTVEEAPRTQIAYGLGAAGLGSEGNTVLRASAEVTRRNVGGLDRSLSLFARMSFRGSRFLARYGEPYLFGRKASLSLAVFREEEERTRFSYDRLGASLETTRGLSEGWNLVARYSFSRTRLNDVQIPTSEIDREFIDATFSGPSLSILNDTRDDPLDPRRGRFMGSDLQFSHAVLGGNSFVKGFFQASAYQPIHPRLVLAVTTRLGLARTFLGEDLAPTDRFFAGGDYSLRGFEIDTVLAEGGRGLALGGLELRLFLSRALSLAVFNDLGNVFPEVADMSVRDLRYTAGVGLRYRTALGPIRLDWARKLNRRPGESSGELHFTVGHAY